VSSATWFTIGEYGFYTPLNGEWVNLEEDGTALKGQLQRFLKLIGFLLDEVKGKVDSFPVIIDIDKTDADLLPSLAELVGVDFSYDLSIPNQREEIKRAVNVYKKKGTINSIKQFCRSVFGFDPEISEWPRRIMFFNNPAHLLPKITTPGWIDKGGLGQYDDPLYYLLDFSESGNYRFDKFGVFFNLSEFAGIPKAEAEKIYRLLSKRIPASTQAKLIFVDATYQFGSADDLSAETFYHAFGTGNESWDHALPFPGSSQTKLVNEIYRRKPDSIVFVDENGKVTNIPSGRFRMVTILREDEPGVDGQFIREQGLFAGAATEAPDSGTLLGVINHKRQWKINGYRIIKTLELAHELSFIVDEEEDFLVFGVGDFVVG
jgi:phage tail-like protein